MCNRYANRVSYRQYVEEFSDTRLPLIIPGAERAPNLEPRDNIRPTERAEVLLPVEGGLELRTIRYNRQLQKRLRPAALPDPGVGLLRMDRREEPENQMAIHRAGQRVLLLRRHLGPRRNGGRRDRELRPRDAAALPRIREIP